MDDLCELCGQPLDLVEMFCESLDDVFGPRYCDDCLSIVEDPHAES